jgi:hypothetical protein
LSSLCSRTCLVPFHNLPSLSLASVAEKLGATRCGITRKKNSVTDEPYG